MKLAKLKVNPDNPQKFSDISKLENSIKEFPKMMELRPLIIDKNNIVLGGNKRLICLQNLGFKEIPDTWIKQADKLTEKEKQRFIIADNVGFGNWDFDLLQDNWDVDKLEDWGVDLEGFDNDFSYINKEIDINNFDDEMKLVLKYSEGDYLKVKEQLSKIASTPGQAVFKLLGNE